MIGGYSLGFGAFEAIVPLQLADHGHGSVGIALVVVCLILPIGAASLMGGYIADRFGAGRVAFIGLFAGSVLSTLLGTLTTLPSLIAVLVAVGIADGFGFTAALSMSAAALPAHRTAALAGVGAAEMLCAGTAAALGARLYTSLDASTTWVVLGITMTCIVAVGGSLLPRQTKVATVDQPEGVFT
jgi:MFS family permease